MSIDTAHLRELARKVDDEPSNLSTMAFLNACTPEAIAALCDRADEAERLRVVPLPNIRMFYWVVQGNYFPREVDSIWTTEEEAKQVAAGFGGDWYVEAVTVKGRNLDAALSKGGSNG